MIAAPDQRGALVASATASPRTTTDDRIEGSTSWIANPAAAVAKPASIVATKAIGHTRTARPPAIAPHTPTAVMARRWSAPWRGWAKPDRNEEANSCMIGSSTNGVVNCDELGAVGECGLHVDLLDHVGDAVHELIASQYLRALRQELGNRPSIAGAFQNDVGDQRDALRMIQLEASCQAPPSDDRGERDQQLLPFPWHEVHRRLRFRSASNTTTSSARGTGPVRTRGRTPEARCAGRISERR